MWEKFHVVHVYCNWFVMANNKQIKENTYVTEFQV
jgi:hypothetical protein